MGRKVMVDQADLTRLLQHMEMGEWASALALTRKLADIQLRDSIRAAQRRNFELLKSGQISEAEYDDNRTALMQILTGESSS